VGAGHFRAALIPGVVKLCRWLGLQAMAGCLRKLVTAGLDEDQLPAAVALLQKLVVDKPFGKLWEVGLRGLWQVVTAVPQS
jgi:hypothetical protein